MTWVFFILTAVVEAWRGYHGHRRAERMVLLGMAFVSIFYNGLKLLSQSLFFFLASVPDRVESPASQEGASTEAGKRLAIQRNKPMLKKGLP